MWLFDLNENMLQQSGISTSNVVTLCLFTTPPSRRPWIAKCELWLLSHATKEAHILSVNSMVLYSIDLWQHSKSFPHITWPQRFPQCLSWLNSGNGELQCFHLTMLMRPVTSMSTLTMSDLQSTLTSQLWVPFLTEDSQSFSREKGLIPIVILMYYFWQFFQYFVFNLYLLIIGLLLIVLQTLISHSIYINIHFQHTNILPGCDLLRKTSWFLWLWR